MITTFDNMAEGSYDKIIGKLTNVYPAKDIPLKKGGTFKAQDCKIQDTNGHSVYINFTGNNIQVESAVKDRIVEVTNVSWIGGQYPKFRASKDTAVTVVSDETASNTSSPATNNNASSQSTEMDIDQMIEAQAEVACKMYQEMKTHGEALAVACAAASISGVAHWWFGGKAPSGLQCLQSTETQAVDESHQADAPEETSQEVVDDGDDDWGEEEVEETITREQELYSKVIDSDDLKSLIKNEFAPAKPLDIVKMFVNAKIITDPGAKNHKEAFAFLRDLNEIPY